jgi:hypothetical protein
MWSPWKCEMTTMSTVVGSTPAAARLAARSVAGIEQHELRPGIHQGRMEVVADLVGRKATRGEERLHVLELGVAGWTGAELDLAHTVQNGGDLEIPDLVAIVAGRLLAGRGRGRTSGCDGSERTHGGRGRSARQDDAAIELGHDVLP